MSSYSDALPQPPKYFPLQNGKYTVAPNLLPLGKDFGQGKIDKQSVTVTSDFYRFRENKVDVFLTKKNSHILRSDFSPTDKEGVVRRLVDLVKTDLADFYDFEETSSGLSIRSSINADEVLIDKNLRLVNAKFYQSDGTQVNGLEIKCAVDALYFLFQEDLAVVKRFPESAENYDKLVLLNVCGPSHWDPRLKIGRSFVEVHQPVPHNDGIIKFSKAMVDTMVLRGPLVRFVWSFVTDKKINHHPDLGLIRKWGSAESPFCLRIEKQVIQSLPNLDLGLFFIGINFIEAHEIASNPKMKDQLVSTLKSMSPDAIDYKGMSSCKGHLFEFLDIQL